MSNDRRGWVDDDSTVNARTAEGERALQARRADEPKDELASRRRYDELARQVQLLGYAIRGHGLDLIDAPARIAALRQAVAAAEGIGDLTRLIGHLDRLSEQVMSRQAYEREQERAARELDRIVAKAQELASSTDWSTTSDAFDELSQQWATAIKKAPNRVQTDTWRGFRSARDRFRKARDAALAEREFSDTLRAWAATFSPKGEYSSHSTSTSVTAETAAQSMIEENMAALLNRDFVQEPRILVYVGGEADDASLAPIEEALEEVLNAYGYDIRTCKGPFRGSITKLFKGLWRRTKEIRDCDLGQDLAAEMQRAIQLRAVDLEQAKVDDAKAAAVAKLMEAAAPHAVVTIQVGAMLLLKAHDMLVVRDLTPREMLYVRRNSHLVTEPRALLAGLNSCDLPTSVEFSDAHAPLSGERRAALAEEVEEFK